MTQHHCMCENGKLPTADEPWPKCWLCVGTGTIPENMVPTREAYQAISLLETGDANLKEIADAATHYVTCSLGKKISPAHLERLAFAISNSLTPYTSESEAA